MLGWLKEPVAVDVDVDDDFVDVDDDFVDFVDDDDDFVDDPIAKFSGNRPGELGP